MSPSKDLYAISVTGPVRGDDLGVTLPHEHLHCDGRVYSTSPPATEASVGEWTPAELERCRRLPLEYPDNLDMRDPATAVHELERFHQAGGRTIVELTTVGLSPDRAVLSALSQKTGVTIVAGTGYYVEESLSPDVRPLDIDTLARAMAEDITLGEPTTGARAGIIGEIGTSDPLGPTERKVVEAAGLAHVATGCPVNFHFVAGLHVVDEVFTILARSGVTDLSRVVVSHADDVLDTNKHRSIMEQGAYIEYDTFGNEGFENQSGNLMPSDEERIAALSELISWGFGHQLLASHDVCMKMFWSHFGGFGYTKLLDDLAASFSRHGLSEGDLARLFVENPKRLLCYASMPET